MHDKSMRFHTKKAAVITAGLLIIMVFFIFLNHETMSHFSIRPHGGNTAYHEPLWYFGEKGGTAEAISLPNHAKLQAGKSYVLSTTLSYDGSGATHPYGYLHLDHLFCRILLDGKTLFSCMPEDHSVWAELKSPGFIFTAFPLPADCMGKELTIELLPMLTANIDYVLPQIPFGDISTQFHQAVIRDVPHDIIAVLCVMLGISAIIFSSIILHGSRFREGFSIGVFSLLFSLYLITECSINMYFIGNPYYSYLVNYISFSLLPMALTSFMRERVLEKRRRLFNHFIVLQGVFFLLELCMHFTGIWDFREFIPMIHLVYFLSITIIVFMIPEIQDHRKKRTLIIQLVPIAVGMVIDFCIYWFHLNLGVNDATFTILGVVLFLIVELLHIAKTSIYLYGESVRSTLYKQMAFVDGLTSIGNRRAYEQEIQKITSLERSFHSMIVVSADVNRLKFINDNYGHAAGDHLIQSVAQILSQSFGPQGTVYRTGGDEFAIFLYDTDLGRYQQMLETARGKIDEFNQENAFTMSIAVGYKQIWDNQILEAAKEADRNMYADKLRHNMQRQD